jgi:hypothetical protein
VLIVTPLLGALAAGAGLGAALLAVAALLVVAALPIAVRQ